MALKLIQLLEAYFINIIVQDQNRNISRLKYFHERIGIKSLLISSHNEINLFLLLVHVFNIVIKTDKRLREGRLEPQKF